MDGGMLVNEQQEAQPPGVLHVVMLLGAWVLLTALVEGVLFIFWFASTIAVFSVAGPLPTVIGVAFAVLALAVAPLGCAWIVRRGDRWLKADR